MISPNNPFCISKGSRGDKTSILSSSVIHQTKRKYLHECLRFDWDWILIFWADGLKLLNILCKPFPIKGFALLAPVGIERPSRNQVGRINPKCFDKRSLNDLNVPRRVKNVVSLRSYPNLIIIPTLKSPLNSILTNGL